MHWIYCSYTMWTWVLESTRLAFAALRDWTACGCACAQVAETLRCTLSAGARAGARTPGRAAASRDAWVLSDRLRVQVSGPGAGVHDDCRLVPPRPPPRPARPNQ